MSRSQALAEARRLKTIVESYGITCRIELMQGRPHSNRWYTRKHLLMSHDTVGSMRGNTPSLSVVKYGRPGLPGPLCNAYMGRDLVFRIITMGLGNHPGRGGPLTRDGVTLPRDSARIGSFGIEYEHDGVSEWPDGLREAMARANAAVLDWMDRPTTSAIEHATWTPRKIDRSPRYSRSGSTGQSEIRAVRGRGRDWLDMASEDDVRRIMREEVDRGFHKWGKWFGEWAAHLVWRAKYRNSKTGKTWQMWQYLITGYNRSGSAVYQTQWNRGDGGGLGPGISGRVEGAVEKVLGKVRGEYGSGSDVPVKLNSPGAHRYAWGAMKENLRTQAMLSTLADHLDSTGALKAELTAAAARVEMPEGDAPTDEG